MIDIVAHDNKMTIQFSKNTNNTDKIQYFINEKAGNIMQNTVYKHKIIEFE